MRTIYFEEMDYNFEVEYEDVRQAIIEVYSSTNAISKAKAEEILDEEDLYDQCEEEFDDEIEEVLKEKFYDEAMRQKEDDEAYAKDPYFYYGVNRKDFC